MKGFGVRSREFGVKTRQLLILAIAFLNIVFILACGEGVSQPPPPVGMVDATGQIVELPLKADRIVSMTPSVTQMIIELNEADRLVGVTNYCRLEAIGERERIGTLLAPSVEKIVALEPDLVIASQDSNKSGPIAQLRELGFPVFVVGDDRNYSDIIEAYSQLARLLGVERLASQQLTAIDQRIRTIAALVAERPLKRVMFQVGARPVLLVGGESYLNEIIAWAGGENISGDNPLPYPRMSEEEVIEIDPDVILITVMGDIGQQEKEHWESFPVLRAVRDNAIHIVDSDLVCIPTPHKVATSTEFLARLLHPEAFAE